MNIPQKTSIQYYEHTRKIIISFYCYLQIVDIQKNLTVSKAGRFMNDIYLITN